MTRTLQDNQRLERRHEVMPANAAPELVSLLGFWQDHRARSGILDRTIMDPFNLVPWLGHLSVYEAVDGGRDFRNRLDGTMIVEITGEDWTRRLASAVDAVFGSALVAALREAMTTQESAIHTMKVYQNGLKDITRLLLPIRSRPDRPIDQVFLAIYFDPEASVP